MSRTRSLFGWVLSGTLCIAPLQQAMACAFHGYQPDPTLVDVLMETQEVVLARPSQSDPNRYVAVATLRGPNVSQIEQTADLNLSAPLHGNAQKTMLMARDGAYGPWLELAVLDGHYQQIIEQILAHQSTWYYGDDEARLRFFAKLLNDANPSVRRLALQELDRAPYTTLRGLRLPTIKNLQSDLNTGSADLRPIRILLAGLSQNRSYNAPLSAGLENAIARDAPYVGAYATALIELNGPSAVQVILGRLSDDKGLSEAAQVRLLEALAIQYRSSSVALRRAIAQDVAAFSRSASPRLRVIAARQFGSISRWNEAPSAAGKGAQATTAQSQTEQVER